jgi:hydroxyacylglutathione hydrolase
LIFNRIKSPGIAHNSYLVGARNEAAVIDPRRDCQAYINVLRDEGLNLKYIFETHRNEDYVIGSLELNNSIGGEIYHGPGIDWKYGNTLSDGQSFRVGNLNIKAIHTPGHTDESVSYILTDLSTGNTPIMVFTGDSLFVRDVGRTDLYGETEVKRLASTLYDSIFNKIVPLGDGVILCPAHGGGSVCGANISSRDESTLGIERIQNPLLQFASKDDFVAFKLEEKLEKPYYFSRMEKYNLEGPPLLKQNLPAPLSPKEFKELIDNGVAVVDVNEPFSFGGSHIRGAYNIWLEGLPVFAGWLLSYEKPVLLVLDSPEHLESAVNNLIRVGFDNVKGYLKGGIDSWQNSGFPLEQLGMMSVHDLKSMLDNGDRVTLLDVRGEQEWESGHIQGAQHLYVGRLEREIDKVPVGKQFVVYCSTGHRSGVASSVLLRAGFDKVHNLLGGITAWKAAGYPLFNIH